MEPRTPPGMTTPLAKFSRSFRSLSWVLVSQAGEKLRKGSSFRLPHGNGFARTFALRTLGCLMVTAFALVPFFFFAMETHCAEH